MCFGAADQGKASMLRHHLVSPFLWSSRTVVGLRVEGSEALVPDFAKKVERLRLRVDTNPGMWRKVLIAGCSALGAYFAGKKALKKLQQQVAGSEDGGMNGVMQTIAKGVFCLQSHIGPWSVQDLGLGLAAMSKLTEKEPPDVPGDSAEDLVKNVGFWREAQHWRSLSEAIYTYDPASFSLQSQLPESSIVAAQWNPHQETLRPAYVVCVDPPFEAVVMVVRGTSHVVDILINAGAAPEPFYGGYAHGGFVQATNALLKEAKPHIEKAFQQHNQKGLKLIIVGHSMGAAVGIMCGLHLTSEYPDLKCWGYSPAASMNIELAHECSSFATCFLSSHDIIPRFSITSVEDLRKRICEFDWKKVECVAKDDEDWKKMSKAIDLMNDFQQAQDRVSDRMNELQSQVAEAQTQVCDCIAGQEKSEEQRIQEHSKGNRQHQNQEHATGSNQENEENRNVEDVNTTEENGDEDEKPLQLHPPGKLIVLASDPPGSGKKPTMRSDVAQQRNYGAYPSFEEARNTKWIAKVAKQEDITSIVISPWSISDHMLGTLCEGMCYFQGYSLSTNSSN
ncbi:hypothetical protein O6H91_13G018300 [Diphasiastrum complanatum]|uniref:Uncharacterized protein n=1 Tax=Diphasiastrum complanatum TaxID=34168 RepID=A0ACC2BSJ5_DIPCM|nr:hypothetical protein O6H91_13G018300 [Diphasiastrum complanatum]